VEQSHLEFQKEKKGKRLTPWRNVLRKADALSIHYFTEDEYPLHIHKSQLNTVDVLGPATLLFILRLFWYLCVYLERSVPYSFNSNCVCLFHLSHAFCLPRPSIFLDFITQIMC